MKPNHVLIDFSLIKLEFEWKKVWQLSLESVSEPKLNINIKFNSPKLLEEMKNLQNKKVSRIYLSNGMENIDFYLIGNCLGIHCSMYNSEYNHYLLSKESIDIMIDVLENHRSKICS